MIDYYFKELKEKSALKVNKKMRKIYNHIKEKSFK
jgi:hypothetical protein